MNALWGDSIQMPRFPKLEKDISAEVLIVGGGICGVLCAYLLTQKGMDCVLLEAKTVGSGITQNTTAKITVGHGLIYHQITEKYGKDKAKQYLTAQQDALEAYRQLSKEMDFDFEEQDAYVYTLNNLNALQAEIEACGALGYPLSFVKDTPLPFPVLGAVKYPSQGQMNPLKLLSALTEKLTVYEHTAVEKIQNHIAFTPHGNVHAKHIIVTTHFPFINRYGLYFLKLYQHRSYVIALENAPLLQDTYVDENSSGLSFRRCGNYLLLGGGGHRTGKRGGSWQELRDFAKRYYSNAVEQYCFATQDCMSLDGIPYIGRYSKFTEGLYVATGFHKWGMTSSMAAAMILSRMVEGKTHPCASVFSPSRSMLSSQLAVNAFETLTNFLIPTTKRCPHLGCALKWNPAEHTWDCPCHGSRFTVEGDLIDNPAKRGLPPRHFRRSDG